MTHEELMDRLRADIAKAGTAKAWAERHGVAASYVTDVLRGHRGPGDKILAALGVERLVSYRKIPHA